MRILYGSQNFGYDIENSDRDYAEIVIPKWQDLFDKKLLNKTICNEDGSTLKQIDIRTLPQLFSGQNLADLQLLYSKEYVDIGIFKWFVDRKERIIKNNLYQFYVSNRRSAEQYLSKEISPKNVTRIYIIFKALQRLLEDSKFDIFVEDAKSYREFLIGKPHVDLESQARHWLQGIVDLEWTYFNNYGFTIDSELYAEMNQYIIQVVRDYSLKELAENSYGSSVNAVSSADDITMEQLFALRVLRAMKSKGLTPLMLVEKLDMPTKELFRVLKGEMIPQRIYINRIKYVLDVSEQDLFSTNIDVDLSGNIGVDDFSKTNKF